MGAASWRLTWTGESAPPILGPLEAGANGGVSDTNVPELVSETPPGQASEGHAWHARVLIGAPGSGAAEQDWGCEGATPVAMVEGVQDKRLLSGMLLEVRGMRAVTKSTVRSVGVPG